MKQVEVQIMGQSYLLGCPEGGDAQLLRAVGQVDSAMCKIRDSGKVRARDRIAVLAAINLAFDLNDQQAASHPVPVVADTGDQPSPETAEKLARLVRVIDQALLHDDRLI